MEIHGNFSAPILYQWPLHLPTAPAVSALSAWQLVENGCWNGAPQAGQNHHLKLTSYYTDIRRPQNGRRMKIKIPPY